MRSLKAVLILADAGLSWGIFLGLWRAGWAGELSFFCGIFWPAWVLYEVGLILVHALL